MFSPFRAVVHVAPRLTFNFHVGLVCSLSPEQEGPGGVGVCVCMCLCVCVSVRVKLKPVTRMQHVLRQAQFIMDFTILSLRLISCRGLLDRTWCPCRGALMTEALSCFLHNAIWYFAW